MRPEKITSGAPPSRPYFPTPRHRNPQNFPPCPRRTSEILELIPLRADPVHR